MKKLLPLILSLLLLHSPAYAQSDAECMTEIGDMASPLNPALGTFETVQKPKINKEKRFLSHIVKLPSGATVQYLTGGCAHYSFSYQFSHLTDMPTSKGKSLFDYIRAQLKQLPVDKQEAKNLSDMIDVLQKAAKKPSNWNKPTDLYVYTDATHELELEKDGFTLSYDFAL